jgi:hypothetical protein
MSDIGPPGEAGRLGSAGPKLASSHIPNFLAMTYYRCSDFSNFDGGRPRRVMRGPAESCLFQYLVHVLVVGGCVQDEIMVSVGRL